MVDCCSNQEVFTPWRFHQTVAPAWFKTTQVVWALNNIQMEPHQALCQHSRVSHLQPGKVTHGRTGFTLGQSLHHVKNSENIICTLNTLWISSKGILASVLSRSLPRYCSRMLWIFWADTPRSAWVYLIFESSSTLASLDRICLFLYKRRLSPQFH